MLFHFWFCNVTQWDIIQQNMVKDQMTLEIFSWNAIDDNFDFIYMVLQMIND